MNFTTLCIPTGINVEVIQNFRNETVMYLKGREIDMLPKRTEQIQDEKWKKVQRVINMIFFTIYVMGIVTVTLHLMKRENYDVHTLGIL